MSSVKIPLTKYGWPQVVIFPAVQLTSMLIVLLTLPKLMPLWGVITLEVIITIFLIWTLSFFRDPQRATPEAENLLIAPADGKITDIETVEENNFIGGSATRIGIFLSIFDVHINRAPCNVKVEQINYKKGKYKNAARPSSGRVNESNNLALTRTNEPKEKLILRQISGAIARRIVCTAKTGQNLAGGEKFGMIKFGSRTEIYIPARENAKLLVKIGDKVKAGLTPLVKYE